MVKVDINGTERYYDGYLVNNLELIKQAVALKWDGLFYVGGYEGDGKTEFTIQCAYFVDRTFCLDRCVFTPAQFIEAVNKAEPHQAIVYDESQDVLESTAKDKTAREIKSLLTRIRKKQLYIFMVAPDFWRINKYMFVHRARAFIRVYSNGLERGYFEYYNRTKKHELLIRGKRNEQLCIPPNFRGRYTHWFGLNEEEYDAKKEAATQEIGKQADKKADKFLAVQKRIIEADFITQKQQAALLGVSDRQVRRVAVKIRENEDAEGRTNTKQLTNGVAK